MTLLMYSLYEVINTDTNILDVDPVFSLKFRFIMEWYEYRITYYNLKTSWFSNALTADEAEKFTQSDYDVIEEKISLEGTRIGSLFSKSTPKVSNVNINLNFTPLILR